MRVRIGEILRGQTVLGGAIEGRRHLSLLMAEIGSEPLEPQPLFVDFSGIEVATASYQRETIVTLHRLLRARRSNFYLVVANASALVLEDLAVLANAGGMVFLSCSLDGAGTVSGIALIGKLDPKQQTTFDEVRTRGETDARELMAARADQEEVGQTAFNNRLASLVNLGLIAELTRGKSKRYRPVLNETSYGK